MKCSEFLQKRGFVHQYSAPTLTEIIDSKPRVVYYGIDPTADSAHIGNLVVWLFLKHLADAGHTIIFLVGGGTGMIGDPKPDAERTLLTPDIVASNVASLKKQADKIIGSGKIDLQFVDNSKWLGNEKLLNFLRDIGKHFTINELIKKEAIAKRLTSDTGLSYTEFAYPLLQGLDYLTLYKQYNCTLQVGGSDQWGNIISGVDLIRRKEKAVAHALTVPLVVDKATGKKFGKSEGNAIWLDPNKTTPFAFYQFWLQVSDESVIDYLKLFTFYSDEEILKIEQEWQQDVAKRYAQEKLAYAVTKIVHGEIIVAGVIAVSKVLFSEIDIQQLTADELGLLLENAPSVIGKDGEDVVEILVRGGLATSKREARTFIEAGAIFFGKKKLTEVTEIITKTRGEYQLLKRGKKQLIIVKVE